MHDLLDVELIGQPTPIYMIGDSHCLIFRDLLIHENKHYKQSFITKAKYCSALTASQFLNEEGQLNPQVMQALSSESLLDETLFAFHFSQTEFTQNVSIATDKPTNDPLIVFFCGDVDLRSQFLKQLGENADFVLPFEVVGLDEFEPIENPRNIPFALVGELANKMLKPFFEGLIKLKNTGFFRIYLHSIPPQTLDEEAYERINGYFSPALLRYKSTLLFNYLLENFCKHKAFNFLDLWPEVTFKNKLEPRYHLDHVHLNKKAAMLTLTKLLEHQSEVTRNVLIQRYEKAHLQARTVFEKQNISIDQDIFQKYQQENIHIVPGAMDSGKVESILSQLNFDFDTGNRHFRLDWVGNSLTPNSPHILTAKPTPETLKLIFEFMYSEPILKAIHSCYPYHYVIPTCRPVLSLPHQEEGIGPQKLHLDGGPPGFIRVLLYLSDVDEESGPFEYIDKDGQYQRVTGPAGTLLVFDANAFEHRGSPPRKKQRTVLDFVLLPKIEGLPDYILWPGMNHWPIDPYYFTIHDYVSYPSFESQTLSPQAKPNQTTQQQRKQLELFKKIQKRLIHGQFKELIDFYELNQKDINALTSKRYLVSFYYIARAYFMEGKSAAFENFVRQHQEPLLKLVLQPEVGDVYREFLSHQKPLTHPVSELEQYTLIFLNHHLNNDLLKDRQSSYLFLGDEQHIELVEQFSEQYPEAEVVFIDKEDLKPEELLVCCQQARQIELHKENLTMADIAIILTLSDITWTITE